MNRKCVSREVLIGLVVATAFSAQAAEPTGRSLPVYEVDRAWPKVPPQWKLGDPSSIAIDAKDNVWVLHRPRTLKPEQKAMAAPPVIVFDTAGKYIQAGGGAGHQHEFAEAAPAIPLHYQQLVWVSRES